MSLKHVLNGALAVSSICRSVTLNVLGAGVFWALKDVIESYNRELNLNPVFSPIYFTSLGLLSAWQVLELTVLTKDRYDQEANRLVNPTQEHELARLYPVHYLYNLRRAHPQNPPQHQQADNVVDRGRVLVQL